MSELQETAGDKPAEEGGNERQVIMALTPSRATHVLLQYGAYRAAS